MAAGDLPFHHVRTQCSLCSVVCRLYSRASNVVKELSAVSDQSLGNPLAIQIIPLLLGEIHKLLLILGNYSPN